MKSRSYQGLHDLHAMHAILSEGCKAENGTHYVHRGDLQWWLFYNFDPPQVWQSQIRLWFEDDMMLGWALVSPNEKALDVFTIPSLRGDIREREMIFWALEELAALDEVSDVFVAEDDEVRIGLLEGFGFERADHHFIYLKRSLFELGTASPLPSGFSIRASRGVEDARLRSVASHAAFKSLKPFEEYLPRTVRFMQSPVFVPEHERYVISPDGRVASYCIVWTDDITKVGHFEPVGTHPDFQRKGLGRSLLFDAMSRLKSEGMTVVDICAYSDNEAAIGLYESIGFRKSKRLMTYTRKKKS